MLHLYQQFLKAILNVKCTGYLTGTEVYFGKLTIIPHHIPSETAPNGETSTISAI